MRFFMFLFRLSEKSQLALVPLVVPFGLGSVFSVVATSAIASEATAEAPLDSRLFSGLLEEADISLSRTNATDLLSSSVVTRSASEHNALDGAFEAPHLTPLPSISAEGSYQPQFLRSDLLRSDSLRSDLLRSDSLRSDLLRSNASKRSSDEKSTGLSRSQKTDRHAPSSQKLQARSQTRSVEETQAITLSKLLAAIDKHEPLSALADESYSPLEGSPFGKRLLKDATSGSTVVPSFSEPTVQQEIVAAPPQPDLNALLPHETPSNEGLSSGSLKDNLAVDTLVTDAIATDVIATDAIATDGLTTETQESSAVEKSPALAQVPSVSDTLPERPSDAADSDIPIPVIPPPTAQPEAELDSEDDLGDLRLQLQRSRKDEDEDLGILRLIQTAQAPPLPPKPPIAFLSGRLGVFDTDNAFRFGDTVDSQIYQAGLSLLFFPKLSESTNLYAIAETNIARYGDDDVTLFFTNRNGQDDQTSLPDPDYNEVELQLGLRQKLFKRTFAQIGWRNQSLYEEGYRDKKFYANYIDAQLTHREMLGSRTWLDGFYQARLGFTSSARADRFRQTFTLSLNHKFNRDVRTSVLYQLDFSDYTQVRRFDTYQQLLGVVSYNLTPESRISLFGGTRFGRSSKSSITLDDTFYGASLNVTVPLF